MKRILLAACIGVASFIALLLLGGYTPGGGMRISDYVNVGEEVVLCGRVSARDSSKICLSNLIILKSVEMSQQEIHLKDKIIIEYEEMSCGNVLKVGQTIILRGFFYDYPKATNPGEFDSHKYYEGLNIGGKLKKVKLISASENFYALSEWLTCQRERCSNRLYQVFPEKEAGIMCTILLGDKTGLDDGVRDMYKRNGIIHILSISGLHITFIGMGLYKLLLRIGLPRWLAGIVGSIALVAYGVITGMGISVVRAVIMYLIRMLAMMIGRTYDMLTAVGVAAVVMVVGNPLIITEAGFLLSFASVMGIGILVPMLSGDDGEQPGNKRYISSQIMGFIFTKVDETLREIKKSIIAGLAILLMTLPIQLWFYYEIPLFSIIINLFVLPLMGILLATGMCVMLIPGTGFIGTIDIIILRGYEYLCGIFDKMPVGTWNPGRPEVLCIIIYYLLLIGIGILIRLMKGSKYIKCYRKVAMFIMILAIMVPGAHMRGDGWLTFLDVGQGDGIVLQTDTGGTYIFDCGSSSRNGVGEYVLKPFLKYRGISHISGIIVSHEDIDHCNGIIELIDYCREWNIKVDNIILPKVEGEEFESVVKNAGNINVVYINSGTSWSDGKFRFICLHPPAGQESGNLNASSACFLVEASNIRLLLTGDVEEDGEKALIREMKERFKKNMPVEILKVAHHGSRNSTSEDFLKTIDCKNAVISCGNNNRYGHPHKETLKRLADEGSMVFTTPEYGAITIELGKRVRINGFIKGEKK